MTQTNEKVHEKIMEIKNELDCDMIDAALAFCERNIIDPEDLVLLMDEFTLQRLRLSAIENNAIRKCDQGHRPPELPFVDG